MMPGVIEKVGSGVPGHRIGQRVWSGTVNGKRPLGTCAQFITLPAERAPAMPEPLTFEEAACLSIPALTAYRALATDGGVRGRIVLVAGGAGAVWPLRRPDGQAYGCCKGHRDREHAGESRLLTGAAIRFFIVYELAPNVRAEAIEQLRRWISERRPRHAVAARYPLDRIVGAHESVEQGRHIGNVVVTI